MGQIWQHSIRNRQIYNFVLLTIFIKMNRCRLKLEMNIFWHAIYQVFCPFTYRKLPIRENLLHEKQALVMTKIYYLRPPRFTRLHFTKTGAETHKNGPFFTVCPMPFSGPCKLQSAIRFCFGPQNGSNMAPIDSQSPDLQVSNATLDREMNRCRQNGEFSISGMPII